MASPKCETRPLRAMSRDTDWIVEALSNQIRLEAKSTLLSTMNEPDSPVKSAQGRDRNLSRKGSKCDFVNMETDVIRCICANIHYHISKSEAEHYIPPPQYRMFSKEDTSKSIDPLSYSLEAIQFIFTIIHEESQMEYECIIIALIYLERLQNLTNREFRICPANWRFSLFGCMMLASKMFDDFSMINADYATIFHNFSLEKINQVEFAILTILDFSAFVSEAEYSRMHGVVQSLNKAAQDDVDSQVLAFLEVQLPSSDGFDDYLRSSDKVDLSSSTSYDAWLESGLDEGSNCKQSLPEFGELCISSSGDTTDSDSGNDMPKSVSLPPQTGMLDEDSRKGSFAGRIYRGFMDHIPHVAIPKRLKSHDALKSNSKVYVESSSELESGDEEDSSARTARSMSSRRRWSRSACTVSPMPGSCDEGSVVEWEVEHYSYE